MRAIIRELFETVILALLIFLALQLSVRTYRVEGLSMAPTLDSDEYVLVNKLIYLRFDPRSIARLVPFLDVEERGDLFPFHAPKRGEIVIFRFPKDESRDFVKRVGSAAGAVALSPAAVGASGLAQAPGEALPMLHETPRSVFPTLNGRTRGWLRFLWEKATTDDDWSSAGVPHQWWDRYSAPVVLRRPVAVDVPGRSDE